MKKFLAVVLSIQLLLIQVLPADAQLVKSGVRAVFTQTATENAAKEAFTQTVTTAPVWATSTTTQAVGFSTRNALNLPLENTLTRLTGNAAFADWVRTESVFTRANFTLATKENALGIWRKELAQKTAQISRLPVQKVHPATLATVSGKPVLQAASEVITDISALGLLGSVQDAPRIVNTYRQLADTPFAPAVQQAAAKALLRLRAFPQLQTLLDLSAGKQANWAGLRSYAQENGLTLTFPETTLVSIQANSVERMLSSFGAMTQNAVNGSHSAITWYVNLGTAPTTTITQPSRFKKPTRTAPVTAKTVSTESLQALQLGLPAFETAAPPAASVAPKTAPAAASGNLYSGIPVPEIANKFQSLVQKAKQFLLKDKTGKVLAEVKQDATLLQQASIYLASVVIGLEIGTPIMASLGSSLDLSLSEKILVTAATFLPYSIGSFVSTWLKEKFGRKASANIGLSLMAGSFITGVTALGLDGSFTPWANSMAHFYSILTSLMVASFGGVFIHNAVGPIMTELSKNASELVRQKRVSYTELVRAIGMLSSYAFPFIATSMLGMDWSSSFVMALPFVGLSAAAINLAKIPNTKPVAAKATEMAAGIRRRGLSWKQTLLDNNYLRLFKEDKSVAPLISGLFLMNGVEMAYNSGFLLMLPSLTNNPSSQYLFGLTQYAVPFVLGRFLAGKFLNWFPKHNLSIATGISALGGMAAMGVMDNVYALTAALFAAETGISTAFTLSFAQTAKNTLTQDRVTSLIVASAVACAIFPVLLSDVAQHLIDMGLFTVGDATAFTLVGIPAAMALYSARLFTKVENLTAGAATKTTSWLQKLKAVFTRGK